MEADLGPPFQLPVKFFADAHAIGNNSLSFINYPPIPQHESSTASKEGSRAGAHKVSTLSALGDEFADLSTPIGLGYHHSALPGESHNFSVR
jgi:hypothetical protein